MDATTGRQIKISSRAISWGKLSGNKYSDHQKVIVIFTKPSKPLVSAPLSTLSDTSVTTAKRRFDPAAFTCPKYCPQFNAVHAPFSTIHIGDSSNDRSIWQGMWPYCGQFQLHRQCSPLEQIGYCLMWLGKRESWRLSFHDSILEFHEIQNLWEVKVKILFHFEQWYRLSYVCSLLELQWCLLISSTQSNLIVLSNTSICGAHT